VSSKPLYAYQAEKAGCVPQFSYLCFSLFFDYYSLLSIAVSHTMLTLSNQPSQVPVAHSCNSSYSGGRDQKKGFKASSGK
jgi:hypothetical protein